MATMKKPMETYPSTAAKKKHEKKEPMKKKMSEAKIGSVESIVSGYKQPKKRVM